jgi:uracil phosphoribosyltransferase
VKADVERQASGRLLREIGLLLGYGTPRATVPARQGPHRDADRGHGSAALDGKKLVIVPILRAGLGLAEGVLDLVPLARMGHVGLYRDPRTLQAVEYYFKMPGDITDRDVIVCDPMLATAHSAIAAVDRLKETGARRIKMICILPPSPARALSPRSIPTCRYSQPRSMPSSTITGILSPALVMREIACSAPSSHRGRPT